MSELVYLRKGYLAFFLMLICFGFWYNAEAQKPGWASSYGEKTPYPQSQYLTGFGMATLADGKGVDEGLSQAEAGAQQNLIQKIRIQVEAVSSSYLKETDDEFTSQFVSATRTSANLELMGLRTQTYVDERKGNVYALAYILIKTIRNQFRDELIEQYEEFTRLKEAADRNYSNENYELALDQYLNARALYSEILESWSLTQSVERNRVFGEAGDWSPDQIRKEIASVDRAIERIINRPVRSIDDAAWWLANTMGSSSDEAHRVNISAITYRDSGISSEFANYLRQVLTRQLNNRTNWVIQEMGQNYDRNPTHILTGTFWDHGEDVHVLINVRETGSGRIVSVSETLIPQNVVQESGFSLLPDNYKSAMADLEALMRNEGDNRGLNLSVWTNRGENNLVFEEGDIMEISLQVNLPSYIRILYHLKDSRRVLLLDSHYINPRDVNRPYTLPYRFQAVPPFGVEHMQVIAQSEPFERVQTREVDGLPILAEDLEIFLSNTRGFVMVREEMQQTEQLLTITTMPGTN